MCLGGLDVASRVLYIVLIVCTFDPKLSMMTTPIHHLGGHIWWSMICCNYFPCQAEMDIGPAEMSVWYELLPYRSISNFSTDTDTHWTIWASSIIPQVMSIGVSLGPDNLLLHSFSRCQYHHSTVSTISTLTARLGTMIAIYMSTTEWLSARIKDVLTGWSNTFRRVYLYSTMWYWQWPQDAVVLCISFIKVVD